MPVLIKMGAALLCIAAVTACSTTQPRSTTPPAQVSEWDTRLSGKAGALSITFKLPQQSYAELFLSDENIRPKYPTPIHVVLSNENCIRGHQVAIKYREEANTFLTKYFVQEAIWNTSNTLQLVWNADQKITLTLNDEVIHVEQTRTLRYLKIKSQIAPIAIEKFEYSPKK